MTAALANAAAAVASVPGAQIVDVREPGAGGAPQPGTGPDGRPSFSLAALIEFAAIESRRIDDVQAALVKAGYRAAADPDQANKAVAWRAIAAILRRARADHEFMARLKRPPAHDWGFIDMSLTVLQKEGDPP